MSLSLFTGRHFLGAQFMTCLESNVYPIERNRTEQKIKFSMSPLQDTTVLQPSVLVTGMIGYWL